MKKTYFTPDVTLENLAFVDILTGSEGGLAYQSVYGGDETPWSKVFGV